MAAISCLHPKTIHTKHGDVTVRCGKCEACLNLKASSLSTRCNIESKQHRYTFFITLTYADNFLPLCRVVKSVGYWTFFDVSSRDCCGNLSNGSGVMAICPDSQFNDKFFESYYSKLNLSSDLYGTIPYLSKRDLQLFFKRLRKNLSVYDSSIRYYACGEYGPVHFRPHYHVLLFTDSDKVALNLRQAILSSWQYGRVDCQPAKDGASGYCAKYINSNVYLSAIQRVKAFRPFSTHSRHFAASFYKVTTQTLKEVRFSDFIRDSLVVRGKPVTVFPWMAFEDSLFPKCYGYGQADSSLRLYLYTCYKLLSAEYGSENVEELSYILYSKYFYAYEKVDGFLQEFLTVFHGYYDKTSLQSTFRSILYTSKKFLRLCQTYSLSPSDYLRVIEQYYSSKDYYALFNQLKQQSDYMSMSGSDPLLLLLWYSDLGISSNREKYVYNCQRDDIIFNLNNNPFCDRLSLKRNLSRLEDDSPYKVSPAVRHYLNSIGIDSNFVDLDMITQSPLYYNFASLQKSIYYASVKHKRLQDLNKQFTYGKFI